MQARARESQCVCVSQCGWICLSAVLCDWPMSFVDLELSSFSRTMTASVCLEPFSGSLGLFGGDRYLGCVSLGIVSVSQVHGPGSVSEECVCLGSCLLDEFMCVCACVCMCMCTCVCSTSVPTSLFLPLNMSGVCSHRSPHSNLGHGILCPLIGRFPGVGPRLLAVPWSLERKQWSGKTLG